MRYFLPKSSVKAVNTAIEAVFNRLKGMFLFKRQEPKKIRFVVTGIDKPLPQREDLSLVGVFDAAARSEGVKPDEKLLDTVQQSVAQYLDAQQELAKAKIQNVVQNYITEAELSPEEAVVDKELGERLSEVMEDITQHVTNTLDSELNRAKNVSSLSSISKVCAHIGIEDPTVVFIGPNDGNTCKDCKRLYFLKDGITPRAWKMSEVSLGYGKHGDERPSMMQHPHCFTGNMRLYCNEGMIQMSDLVGKGQLKLTIDKRVKHRVQRKNQYKEMPVGAPYLDRHDSGSKILNSTELGVYFTGDRPCVRITLVNGNSIEVSTEHEMWVDDNGAGIKKKAYDIKIGDKIPLLSGEGQFGKDHFPIEAELMGSLIGDGFINKKNQCANWVFFGNDIPYGQGLLKKACSIEAGKGLKDVHGDNPRFNVVPPDNKKYRVERGIFNSMVLGRYFVREFGFSKTPARVPNRLWSADKETVAAFIRGFMAADGGMGSPNYIAVGQVNKPLLQEIQLLLANFGIASSVMNGEDPKIVRFPNIQKGGERVYLTQKMWRLGFGGLRSLSIFQKEIGFGVPTKVAQLSKSIERYSAVTPHGSWRTSRVVSVEDIGIQPTFCLTEPTLNTVTVNGFVTGQCRHTLAPMMPGFGFKGGKIAFIEPGYDVLEDQRKSG